MFAIGSIDLTYPENILELVNIRSTDTGAILGTPAVGRFRLPPVNITLAIKWEGFDIFGTGLFGISIRRLNPTQYYAHDPVLGWIESVTEVFYSEADFRAYFREWSGAFQLGIQLTPTRNISPQIREVRYGYHTIGDYADYTVKYQLSQFLSVPASFVRTVRINGSSFPIPKGFDPALIVNAGAYETTGQNIDKPLTIVGIDFLLATPQVNAVHQVHFDYLVPIDTQNEYIPQIESVPAVFFRNLSADNLRFLNTRTSISIDEATTRIVRIPYLSDLKLDVLVFGDTAADANAISQAFTRKIAATGGFWNPGFNCDCLVQLMSSVVPSPGGGSVSTNPVSGMLFSNTIKLKLISVPHGTFYTEQPRIVEVESSGTSNWQSPDRSTANWQVLATRSSTNQDTLKYVPPAAGDVWTIDHNLGANPIVSVYALDGDIVVCDIEHISTTRVLCRFTVPFLGYAELVSRV